MMIRRENISGRYREWLAAMITSAVSLWLTWPTMSRQWIPHDEGMLGQTAERIRLGQLPHRDFEELYTGGLSYWHAMMQYWFGAHLMSARYGLLMAWGGWLLLVFWLVRRTNLNVHVGWAMFATCVIGAWTLPIYPAAMPSWYVLFLGTAAMAALLHWSRTMHRRWLIMGGVTVGLALLVKITALYLMAAALLSVIIVIQQRSLPHERPTSGRHRPTFSTLVSATVLSLLIMVLLLLRNRLTPAEIVHLVFPVAVVGIGILDRDRMLAGRGSKGVREACEACGWLLSGVAVVVVPFVMFFVAHNGLQDLVRGVFIDAVGRVGALERPMRELSRTVSGLWFVAFCVILLRAGHRSGMWVAGIGVAVLYGWLGTASLPLYRIVWEGVRWLLPVTVAFGAMRYARQPVEAPLTDASGRTHQETMIIVTFVSLLALNQFPFAAPVYFVYVVPLVMIALVTLAPECIKPMGGVLLILAIFAMGIARKGSVGTLGQIPLASDVSHRMTSRRSGLSVDGLDSLMYQTVDSVVRQHRGSGTVIAGPDAPEVTFLSGPPYYGRVLFNAWPSDMADSSLLARYFGSELPSVVVFNLKPPFAPDVSPQMRGWFESRYPNGMKIWSDGPSINSRWVGRGFEVRWR